jgi:arylsulfatase A-like enzyme
MGHRHFWSVIAGMLAGIVTAASVAAAPPNVLFVIADDASCHFGAYGCRWAKTPHVDALAAGGIVFDGAYVPT